MGSVRSLLLLFLLSLVEVHCQQTFPYVSFMGQTLVNHSYVDLSTVGHSNSVQCHTDLSNIPTSAVHDDNDISVRETVYVGLYSNDEGK